MTAPAAPYSVRVQVPNPDHPVDSYALRVLAGDIVANKWVKLAAQRHIDDLADGWQRGLCFDYEAADRGIAFYGYLRLYKGAFAGKPFALFDWQQFATGSICGWKQADGCRRFRTAYIEGAKGCGKTPWAAGQCLYFTEGDREPAAENYVAATDKKQASIALIDSKKMAEESPALRKRLQIWTNSIVSNEWGSSLQAMSSDMSQKSGWRVHFSLIDELHEHKDDRALEMLTAGQKEDLQPLQLMITNSGFDRTSVCWVKRKYSTDVLEKLIVDDEWFALVFGIDEGDDWRDESVWVKANPSYPVIPTPQFLRKQVREAKGMPSKEDLVRRLHFCEWTEQKSRWIDLALWDEQDPQTPREELFGRRGWVGVDLSSNDDVTAVALWVPDSDAAEVDEPEDEEADEKEKAKRPTFGGDLFMWFFLPEDELENRARHTHQPLQKWVDEGHLTLTPGNVIDYDFIHDTITNDIQGEFEIESIGIDPHQAHQISKQLSKDGFTVVSINQNATRLNEPMKELQRILKVKGLRHGGHPILRWMAGNAVAVAEVRGMLRLDKEKSPQKIDGLSATVDALAEFLVADLGTEMTVTWSSD